MTRKEEIKKIASAFAIDEVKDTCNPASKRGLLYAGFVSGAQWADQHPHWISVEDELPQKNGMYIFLQSGIIYTATYYKSKGLHRDVTHWMPLPPPPVVSKMENTGKRIMFKKKAEKQRITMKEVAAILDNPIDWEQRRFEVAKDAYIKIIGTIEKAVAENKTDRDNLDYTSMAYDAIGYANILIEQLMIEVRGGEQ